MNTNEKTVYLVTNYFFILEPIEEMAGIYSDKESAIKVAKKEWDKYGNWQSRLAVPYMLYLTHIDDFEKKHPEDNENVRSYDFHDYLGYTSQEWQLTEDAVRAFRIGYSRTDVLQHTLDEKDACSKTVWTKEWKETTLIPCRENGKWGFRDKATTKYVVPPTYDDCIQLQGTKIYWVEFGNNYGYHLSKKLRKVTFWSIKNAGNGKWGVVNENGQLIIPAEYDEIGNEMLEGSVLFQLFKATKNGKYGLLNDRGEMILPFAYDDFQYHIERKKGILYVSAQRNGKQERHIISEDGDHSAKNIQKLRDSWFEWTKEAAQAVIRLNRALFEAEESARKEYNARKTELKLRLAKGDKFLTDYAIGKALKLSMRVGNGSYALTDPTGFMIDDDEKDWFTTLGEDVERQIKKKMSAEFLISYHKLHYGFHVLHNHQLLAWEDILRIRSVQAEVCFDYQKNNNLIE
jgi:hypothetical protein